MVGFVVARLVIYVGRLRVGADCHCDLQTHRRRRRRRSSAGWPTWQIRARTSWTKANSTEPK